MAELRLELLLSPDEELTIFNSDTDIKIADLSESQLEIFNNFVNFTGENFASIENTPEEFTVAYWNKDFKHDENYQLDPIYERISFDYNLLTETEKNTVDSFIAFINSIK
jgi:hypothetical protein